MNRKQRKLKLQRANQHRLRYKYDQESSTTITPELFQKTNQNLMELMGYDPKDPDCISSVTPSPVPKHTSRFTLIPVLLFLFVAFLVLFNIGIHLFK